MRELERDPSQEAASGGPAALPAIALIGPGRLGTALARAAARAGIAARLAGRDEALDACRRAEVALLCVPDEAVTDACRSLARAVPPLRLVGHTSGALGLDAVEPAMERGAACFSLHPLQTIPDPGAELAGAACAVSGSTGEARALAASLAAELGMTPFEVPEGARAAYHAAAAIASNFLVALEEAAADLLERAGMADSRRLLAPLVLRTASNWVDRGGAALTGPIARGDEATVERHLAALGEHAPELLPLYEALAERARELAARRRGAGAPA